jgi:ribonuclease T1
MKRYAGLDRVAVLALVALVVVGAFLFLRPGGSSSTNHGSRTGSGPSATSSPVATKQDPKSYVARSALPAEARATIVKIQAGGPFPFERDGFVFANREGLLPAEPSGFYHEYTVATPGSADRGARRIVQASNGVLYWSPDHYRSFRQIALGR